MPTTKRTSRGSEATPTDATPVAATKSAGKKMAVGLHEVMTQSGNPAEKAKGSWSVHEATVAMSDDFELVAYEKIPSAFKATLAKAHAAGNTHFAKCKKCDSAYLYSTQRDNYVKHLRFHREETATPKTPPRTPKTEACPKTPQAGVLSPGGSDFLLDGGKICIYYVIMAFIFSGISVLQLARVLYCLSPVLAYAELAPEVRFTPPACLYTPVWDGTKGHCEELYKYIHDVIAGRKFQIAIDAGMSAALRQHCLIVCVFIDSKCYCLPPHYTAKPMNSKDIHVALIKTLKYIGKGPEDVSFIVLDGAANNWAFIDQLDYVLTPEDEAWIKKEGVSLHQIKEFVRDHFSGRAVYCRGHMVKVMIDHCKDCLRETYPLGMTAVDLFRKIFFNNPGRVGRFRAYYDKVLIDQQEAKPQELSVYQAPTVSDLFRIMRTLFSWPLMAPLKSERSSCPASSFVGSNITKMRSLRSTNHRQTLT